MARRKARASDGADDASSEDDASDGITRARVTVRDDGDRDAGDEKGRDGETVTSTTRRGPRSTRSGR